MSDTCTAIRGGSWTGGAPQLYGTGPVVAPGIVGWALTYVQPLPQWFDELLGDPGEVEGTAASWQQVTATLMGVADELESVQRGLGELEGRFARTLELRYTDLAPVARDAAEWADAIAAAARLSLSIVTGVRSFITDFLQQLSDFIGALFEFTLNPFDKVKQLKRLVSAATELITAGQRLINQMLDAFERLIVLLSKLGPVIDEALVKLREAIAQMMPLVGGLLGALGGGLLGGVLGTAGGGVLRDAMTDIGDVERYDIDELRRQLLADPTNEDLKKQLKAWNDAHEVQQLDSFADLVSTNGTSDGMGGSGQTAVDIKLVRAADGSEHWVVSLPSTQEWVDMFGDGAMNDGKNNLALMLDNPAIRTQYERMVMQAMKESGMAPGDPVVFTGFSQGGIMAANLASNPDLPYRPIGVVTNGSPIDTFNVPPHIPVVSFQHAADPVARLDLGGAPGTPPNVERIVLPNPGGSMNPSDTHNNSNYVDSVNGNPGLVQGDYSWMGGEVIDHQVFSSEQR
ncbi:MULTISPECIES: hypothetical protein [unclassified Leucobacter]|uniref:hypothetical protein n=1 Tax=unclassified Leucobacter TaxID=2621730 RepID=UPI00165DC7BC|nr:MULTISPECIES: hypothetical protein [unclassified Leucobacter]MBC9927493.1 hypothetical protein [Leucobacter sp. cx-169]